MSKTAYVDEQPPEGHYHEYYSVTYYCGNCGKHGYVYIKKGIRNPMITCSKCECCGQTMINHAEIAET